MGWYKERRYTFKNSIAEYIIEAPSSYRGPEVEPGIIIDSILLAIQTYSPGGKYHISLLNGMFPNDYEVGTAFDRDSAIGAAKGFMSRYDTWIKVLNYLNKTHKFNLRTYGV